MTGKTTTTVIGANREFMERESQAFPAMSIAHMVVCSQWMARIAFSTFESNSKYRVRRRSVYNSLRPSIEGNIIFQWKKL